MAGIFWTELLWGGLVSGPSPLEERASSGPGSSGAVSILAVPSFADGEYFEAFAPYVKPDCL